MAGLLKIIKGISYIVVVLFIAIIAAAILLSRWGYAGYRAYVVLSGSMEPSLHPASVVLVVPQKTYQVGDVITLAESSDPNTTLTHRIQDSTILDGKTQYVTKGDANEDPDLEKRRPEQVIGKVIFSVPYLGYLVTFTRTPVGLMIAIIIPATVIVYNEFVSIKHEIKRMISKKQKITV